MADNYDAPVAPGRDSAADLANPLDDRPRGLSKTTSNQERATGEGTRTVPVPASDVDDNTFMGHQRTVGNQVRIGPNTKGSGTLKDPLNTYQRRTLPPVQDPSAAQGDLSAVRPARKKASNEAKTTL